LISSAEDIIAAMNWDNVPLPEKKMQRLLFPEISLEERKILELIGQQESVFIDTIHQLSGLRSSDTAAAILNLELLNLVRVLPGKRYQII
jgi:DNA processing protein